MSDLKVDYISRVVFVEPDIDQRRDCINNNCKGEVKLQAVYGNARIRCCLNMPCMQQAAESAYEIGCQVLE